jgi:4-amino-4-deoxy-L-arabinose transferase-like glycosyltransferase
VNSTKCSVLLVTLALITRVVAALAIGTDFHFADEAIYVDTARRLSQGGDFGADYSQVPGYPVFLMLVSLGNLGSPGLLRLAQAVVVSMGAIPVFWLADCTFGRLTAIAAGLVYALDPLLVISSGLLYPEAISALVLPLAVLTIWQGAMADKLPKSALAGGLLGLLALLRPVALILPVVVAVWIALGTTLLPRRRLVHVAAFALAFLLVLSPWTVRNYRVHRQLVPVATAGSQTAPVTQKQARTEGLVLAMARWAWHDPSEMASRVTRQFLQFWELAPTRLTTDDPMKREALHQRDPRLQVQPLFSRGLRDLVSAGSFVVELILALVGLAAVVRTHRRPALLLVLVILAWAVGYALFVAKLRYRIPVLPLLFVFTGAGAVTAIRSVQRTARNGASVASAH